MLISWALECLLLYRNFVVACGRCWYIEGSCVDDICIGRIEQLTDYWRHDWLEWKHGEVGVR